MGLLLGMLFLLALTSFLTFGTVWAKNQATRDQEEVKKQEN